MRTRTALMGVAGAAAGAVAVGAAAGIGGIFAALAREALTAERAVDDGPDELIATPAAEPIRREVVATDGTHLYVEIHGPDPATSDAEVIVAAHGWTCNTSFWNAQINRLTPERTVVVYDQRGHGRSQVSRTRPTIDLLGQDLDAVLTAVLPAGRKAMIIGHSMGGMTVMSWAAQFAGKVPDVASSVALISTAAVDVLGNHRLIPENLPFYSRPFQPTVGRLVTSTPVPLPHTAFNDRFSHYIALGPHARAAHVAFVDAMVSQCPARVRAGWGAAMGRLDVLAGLRALRVPTTVIVGDRDRLTPVIHAERMAQVLRDQGDLRDLVVLEGVGHMAPIEAAGVIDDILEQQATETGSTLPADH
ncbi:alpha/beta hydrolase [Gordonia desulfuricans]|uniref:Alpha/beta hydrolase n=1 Tax=Gordonia desulfuricans TaxID=89051 RepID=A0A7K3LVL2_9ACTN|nr:MULTISPECIES: alpha/beta hydrolase [Gordonia]KOY49153.1 alpha/beta hydrolase [Gordonia sp. NB41Y]NDK92136.1 alpha/beta hydrolase [Gordonia desulfuricans]WLP89331.1 alpha/beta hydrolase [Gordonia sp. NB41Y]